VGLVAFLGLFILPLRSFAQEALNLSGASNCTARDFDANVDFRNGPSDYFTVVVDKRNISDHPCIFDGPRYGPSFVPDRVQGDPPVKLCYECEEKPANGQHAAKLPLTLEPGQVARQTFRWKTRPASEDIRCLSFDWMSDPVLLVTPSLFKRICSEVQVSGFSLLEVAGDASTGQIGDSKEAPVFELTSDKSKYYQGENITVQVARTPGNPGTATEAKGCSKLYLRERSPDGGTRVDEAKSLALRRCEAPISGHESGSGAGFELDSGANSRWGGTGEHAIEILQLLGSADDAELHFASSNILRIQVVDSAAIERKWGPQVKGIAADITLDKETFHVGEDVRLHLAIEDFDAEGTIYSWDPVWDPCEVFRMEVRDASGRILPVEERFAQTSLCMGHGLGPKPVVKGKVVPMEHALREQGWLPNHPGTYTVVLTWAPCVGPEKSKFTTQTELKPYAVARAVATIHIVGGEMASLK
jgi:hypothetical protein